MGRSDLRDDTSPRPSRAAYRHMWSCGDVDDGGHQEYTGTGVCCASESVWRIYMGQRHQAEQQQPYSGRPRTRDASFLPQLHWQRSWQHDTQCDHQLPEDYPAACKVEGYPRDWIGPKGCKCKNKCFQQNFSDPLSEKVCHTEGLCFGKTTGTCIKTAQDANATADCHKSCGTCSPGRDLDGTPSATGCRT